MRVLIVEHEPNILSFLDKGLSEAVSNLARALEYYAEVGDLDQAAAVAEFPDYSLGLPSVASS